MSESKPEPLPELLDPHRAVSLGSHYAGRMDLARLSRLRPLLESADGSADYRLTFGRDERGFGVVKGRVVGELQLRCQRCNGEMALRVDSELTLAVVDGLDEAAALPDDYDPLLLDGRLMRSSELIEDELLLALPVVPRHPEGSCEAAFRPSQPEVVAGDAERVSGSVARTRIAPHVDSEAETGPDAETSAGAARQREEQPASKTESKRPNPFAALAALRRDQGK